MKSKGIPLTLLASLIASGWCWAEPPGGASGTADPGAAIRSIDFLNFAYKPNLCAKEYGTAGIGRLVSLHDGEFKNSQVYYGVVDRKVFYGDLTGDGTDEAVVHVACGHVLANYGNSEIFVFTLRRGKVALLATIDDRDMERDYARYHPKGILGRITDTGVKVNNGRLVLERFAEDTLSLPEDIATFRYRWNGKRLTLEGRPTAVPFTQ